jgi:hypothetical protein
LMIANIQRPFVFFVAIGLLVWASCVIGKSYAKKSITKVSSTGLFAD